MDDWKPDAIAAAPPPAARKRPNYKEEDSDGDGDSDDDFIALPPKKKDNVAVTSNGSSSSPPAAKSPALQWPQPSTLAKMPTKICDEVSAIFQNETIADSERLLEVASLLDAEYGEEGENLIFELVTTHSATTIVSLFGRTSDYHNQNEVESVSTSLQNRLLMGYRSFEHNSPRGTVLLFPIMVVAEGISGYDTTTTHDEPFNLFCGYVRRLTDATRGEKNILPLTTELNRLNRSPEIALKMIKQLFGCGATVKLMKQWELSSLRDYEEYVQAWKEYKEEMNQINKEATHVDPAKALRDGVKGPYRKLQANINSAYAGIKTNLSDESSDDHALLEVAVGSGVALCEKHAVDKPQMKAIFERLRSDSGLATDEAKAFYLSTNSERSQTQQKMNVILARATYDDHREFVEFNFHQEEDVDGELSSRDVDEDLIEINGHRIPARQVAKAEAFLSVLPRHKDTYAKFDRSVTTNVVLSAVAKRDAHYIEAFATSCSLIARGLANSFILTSTNRSSSFEGYNFFIEDLCKLTDTEFIMTECIGIRPRPVARAEQKRKLKTQSAYVKLKKSSGISEDGTNGAQLPATEDLLRRSCRGEGGPEIYYLIKRLRALFDEKADGTADAALELHSLARGLIFRPGDHMLTVVASPHMAQFLLGDEEDLLNDKTRMIRNELAKYNGRPSEEFIEGVENEDEREALRKLCDKYDALDSVWGEPSSMSFCYLYFNLLVACILQCQPSRISTHDGNGKLRGGDPRSKSAEVLLSTAAIRRAMTLWSDPLVLKSCGDAMAPAASLALNAVEYYEEMGMLGGSLCRKHELVPGLSIDRAAMTCFSELLERAGSAQYSVKLLKTVGRIVLMPNDRWDADGVVAPWADLPIERRATFALATIQYVMDSDDGDDGISFGGRGLGMPSDEVNNIFKTICGMQNPMDEDLANSVWQKAAEDGESIGPEASGQNFEGRSFIYYLLRGNFPAEEWESLDLVELVNQFSKLPRIHRAPDDEKVKEKDECLRLVYGDKLHDELNAIFSK